MQPSCIPAMGPDYPASCLAYFAPNTTQYATLEFTPNLGAGHELERNTLHLEQMALTLLERGVRTVLVSIVPMPPTCMTCTQTFLAGHTRVAQVASRTGVPLVVNKFGTNASEWSDDLKHLNEHGHKAVADAVLAHFAVGEGGAPSALQVQSGARNAARRVPSHPWKVRAVDEVLPACVFGADLVPHVLRGSHGFELTNGHGRLRDKPGLLATQPASVLHICLPNLPPSFGVSLALERSDLLPMSNLTFVCEAPCSCPNELLSNGDWTLHFRGKGGRRATENYMHRVFGSRRGAPNDGGGSGVVVGGGGGGSSPGGSAVSFGALASQQTGIDGAASISSTRACDCVLTMRNTANPYDPNARAKINGFVAGGSGAIGWANRFHMGLNANVLSGRRSR